MAKRPPKQPPRAFALQDLLGDGILDLQRLPLRGHPEITLRDEANAITAQVFRNGFLEDLHAGVLSPFLDDPHLSRISDEEMKKLMLETSARLANFLYLREVLLESSPERYIDTLKMLIGMFASRWDRESTKVPLERRPAKPLRRCASCSAILWPDWRCCPICCAGAGPSTTPRASLRRTGGARSGDDEGGPPAPTR